MDLNPSPRTSRETIEPDEVWRHRKKRQLFPQGKLNLRDCLNCTVAPGSNTNEIHELVMVSTSSRGLPYTSSRCIKSRLQNVGNGHSKLSSDPRRCNHPIRQRAPIRTTCCSYFLFSCCLRPHFWQHRQIWGLASTRKQVLCLL